MRVVGVIPARHAAARFPGKPLASIGGLPMVAHVYRGACEAKRLGEVLIATDDERIAEVCRGFGANVVLTRPDHPTGTDRLAEVAAGRDEDIVVNIQGDEPLIEGFVIDAAVEALQAAPDAPMSTVVHEAEADALDDPNRVKVVLDQDGYALYFSRSPIPARRPHHPAPRIWQHVGLYAYRREFLAEFVTMPQTPAEQAEGLEQLRALENGRRIRCAVIEGWESTPVDVPADIFAVEAKLAAKGG